MLTLKCKWKARIRIGTVHCILVRGTKISYRVQTALVCKPWTSVLNLWVNIIYDYPSRNYRRHESTAPREEEEEAWVKKWTVRWNSSLNREKCGGDEVKMHIIVLISSAFVKKNEHCMSGCLNVNELRCLMKINEALQWEFVIIYGRFISSKFHFSMLIGQLRQNIKLIQESSEASTVTYSSNKVSFHITVLIQLWAVSTGRSSGSVYIGGTSEDVEIATSARKTN